MREDIDCGIMEYKCRKCEKPFVRAKDAAYHEKRCGECFCSICNKKFICQISLQKHLKIHQQTYKCQICSKIFSNQYNLRRHMNVHSKNKEFSCQHCNAKFTLKAHQKRHEKI